MAAKYERWAVAAAIVVILVVGYLMYLLSPGVFVDILYDLVTKGKTEYVLGIGSGISMFPAIEPGDLVIIDTNIENIRIGDVIVFQYDGKLVGHRVLYITEKGVITKGDFNPYVDGVIPYDKIVGKIVYVVRDPNPLDRFVLECLFRVLPR